METSPVAHIFDMDDEELVRQAELLVQEWSIRYAAVFAPPPDVFPPMDMLVRELERLMRSIDENKMKAAFSRKAMEDHEQHAENQKAVVVRTMRAVVLIQAYETIGALK